jgi:hypothetical protein
VEKIAALVKSSRGETAVKGLLVLIAALTVALAFSSGASANSAGCGHSATSCSSGQLGGGNGTSNGQGTLPFTGLGLAGITGVGVVLLGSGLALQRAGRRRQQ